MVTGLQRVQRQLSSHSAVRKTAKRSGFFPAEMSRTRSNRSSRKRRVIFCSASSGLRGIGAHGRVAQAFSVEGLAVVLVLNMGAFGSPANRKRSQDNNFP